MTVWYNPIVSIRELSKMVPFQYEWLLAATSWKENPMPTILRGKRHVVIYSDFCDWLTRLYGIDGIYRGQEVMELRVSKTKNKKR